MQHRNSNTLTHNHTLAHTHSRSHTHTLSLTLPHTHSLTHSLTRAHKHSLPPSLSLTLTLPHLFDAVEFIFFTPFPVILKVAPGCVPAFIFMTTVPSTVRTSAVDPRTALWNQMKNNKLQKTENKIVIQEIK